MCGGFQVFSGLLEDHASFLSFMSFVMNKRIHWDHYIRTHETIVPPKRGRDEATKSIFLRTLSQYRN